MEADLWERLSRAPLYLDRTSQRLKLDRQEVARFYEPRISGFEWAAGCAS